MKKLHAVCGAMVVVSLLFLGGPVAEAQTSSSNSSAYISSLIEIIRAQIQQAQSALSNVTNVPAWTIPTSSGNNTGGTGSTCVATAGTTTGSPSTSPTVTPPSVPASSCVSPELRVSCSDWNYNVGPQFCIDAPDVVMTCGSLSSYTDAVKKLPGQIGSFSGDIASWAGGPGPNGARISAFIQPEIQYAQQKIAWFSQLYGNASTLLEGSSAPLGSSARNPIVLYNYTTRQYRWMPGFGPADLHAQGFLSQQWSLYSLFVQTKNSPPSSINPQSQVAVMIGLGEDRPSANTSRTSNIGVTYRFNGTVWENSSGGVTCTPNSGSGSTTNTNTNSGSSPTSGSSTNTSGFPKTVTILVNLVNVRSGADTSASVIGTMTKNQTFVATALVNGESIHGESRWWLRQNGGYIWSGNTNLGVSGGSGFTSGNSGTSSGNTGSTGQPSASPTVTGPTMPTGTCVDPGSNTNFTCSGVNAAIALIKRIPGYGAAGFTGDLTSYIRAGFGEAIASHPLVQAEIRYAEQKMNWFPQVYGSASVLPEGSSAPLGSGGRAPIAVYNTETRAFRWMPGFSPAELAATSRLASTWSLYSLFAQVKAAPPSQVNPVSQVAVMLGLGEDAPASGTSRTSSIGGTYRFNGSVWVKQ